MGQKPTVKPDRRLALFSLTSTLRSPIEYAAFEVDISTANGRMKSSSANRRVASASIKPDQYESRDMLADISLRCLVAKYLFSPPGRPN
jgi:hypothetical protein